MMDENVYAAPAVTPTAPAMSPEAARAASLWEENPVGIWQDGKQLVINMDHAQFPPVCVMSCEKYEGPYSPVKINYVPNAAFWGLVLGAVGVLIAQMVSGKKRTLQLPISDAWFREKSRINWTGGLWIVGGLLLFAIALALSINFVDQTNPQMINIASIATAATLLVPVSGLIYLLIKSKRVITAKKMDNTFAWLNNVSPEYVKQFPKWPNL